MLPPRATTICHWPSATVCEWSSGRAVQTGRPSWQFLGEAAGSVGVSCLNWRDPHGSSWGRRLGGLGVLSKWERPPWRSLGEAAGRVGCPVSCMWVAWPLFLLLRPPRPGQPQGRGGPGAPVSPGPRRSCLTSTRPHPCSPSQGASCRPLPGAQPVACAKVKF